MTRAELWAIYVARNPSFAGNGQITLSAAGLRKLLNITWTEAEVYGREAAKSKGSQAVDDLFNRMFPNGKVGK